MQTCFNVTLHICHTVGNTLYISYIWNLHISHTLILMMDVEMKAGLGPSDDLLVQTLNSPYPLQNPWYCWSTNDTQGVFIAQCPDKSLYDWEMKTRPSMQLWNVPYITCMNGVSLRHSSKIHKGLVVHHISCL